MADADRIRRRPGKIAWTTLGLWGCLSACGVQTTHAAERSPAEFPEGVALEVEPDADLAGTDAAEGPWLSVRVQDRETGRPLRAGILEVFHMEGSDPVATAELNAFGVASMAAYPGTYGLGLKDSAVASDFALSLVVNGQPLRGDQELSPALATLDGAESRVYATLLVDLPPDAPALAQPPNTVMWTRILPAAE